MVDENMSGLSEKAKTKTKTKIKVTTKAKTTAKTKTTTKTTTKTNHKVKPQRQRQTSLCEALEDRERAYGVPSLCIDCWRKIRSAWNASSIEQKGYKTRKERTRQDSERLNKG
jgi:hypothetical protein